MPFKTMKRTTPSKYIFLVTESERKAKVEAMVKVELQKLDSRPNTGSADNGGSDDDE